MLTILLLTACDFDAASSPGELGNLRYVVSTDFDIEESVLDVTFLTRHRHYVAVHATEQGQRRGLDDTDEWQHRSDAAKVTGDAGSFAVRRARPGAAAVETYAADELVDRITLAFDDPASLEIQAWSRPPWAEDWGRLDAGEIVEVGTQVAFLGIPLDADGSRLFTAEPALVDAVPRERVVPDVPVDDVWEDGPRNFTGYEAVTFYVIGEGPVTFTLSLEGHELSVPFGIGAPD